MLVRFSQFPNAEYPSVFTLSGITTLVRLLQPLNEVSPIDVRLLGSVMLEREEQELNAKASILVTLSGIVTLLSVEQPENAP